MTDTVIKVGGSLLKGNNLIELCKRLGDIGKKQRLLIVPGGGIFADDVRVLSEKYKIDQDTAHWMAILAMNLYGYLLASLIPGSLCTEDLAAGAQTCADSFQPVVFQPYRLLKEKDPLPHSWDVTSDSIAAWIAGYFEAERLVLVKSTDMSVESGNIYNYRSPVDLERLRKTDIVDPMFYTIMKEIKMRSEDNSLSSFPLRRESIDRSVPWIPAFAGMTDKRDKSNPGQHPETGLWIVNGNYPKQLTGLFEHFKMI